MVSLLTFRAASQELQGSNPGSALGRAVTAWTHQYKQKKGFIREMFETASSTGLQNTIRSFKDFGSTAGGSEGEVVVLTN